MRFLVLGFLKLILFNFSIVFPAFGVGYQPSRLSVVAIASGVGYQPSRLSSWLSSSEEIFKLSKTKSVSGFIFFRSDSSGWSSEKAKILIIELKKNNNL